ncbi:hypothetical protein BDV97DRAFT_401153 [Delphinella strobiligena]|nr:hypothetical protein BDV97DRAFT_401153 [Delphinella strobiligena]
MSLLARESSTGASDITTLPNGQAMPNMSSTSPVQMPLTSHRKPIICQDEDPAWSYGHERDLLDALNDNFAHDSQRQGYNLGLNELLPMAHSLIASVFVLTLESDRGKYGFSVSRSTDPNRPTNGPKYQSERQVQIILETCFYQSPFGRDMEETAEEKYLNAMLSTYLACDDPQDAASGIDLASHTFE